MKRFRYLDWMRGLAVVIMIQCHVFNSFTNADLRDGGPYRVSQSVGGIAAPLFLFMAGMTFAFQMESLERREPGLARRWLFALRRAGYVWGIAFLFRLTSWAASWPEGTLEDVIKVDILNCMGLAMAAFAALAAVPTRLRAQAGAGLGLAIAILAPVVANLDWNGAPRLLHEYLAPGPWRARFAFFPCAAYVGFGLAAGTILKRTPAERLERTMQWSAMAGIALIFTARYFSEVPYSVYENADFWRNSPGLILIRAGVMLLLLPASFLWTEYSGSWRWSWVEALGKTSLLIYWVHVMLVYGSLLTPLKRALTVPQTSLAFVSITALMAALAAGKLRLTTWRKSRPAQAAAEPEPDLVTSR